MWTIDASVIIRDLAPRFEHKLFLSATPHNGHSNSFSALLDVLVDKTRTIHEELGSLSPVIERRIDRAFQRGIEHDQADILARTLERVDVGDPDDPHTPHNPGEARQLAADRRHWDTRLEAIARELIEEPERVRRSYLVKAARVEPVGLVYLWPLSS